MNPNRVAFLTMLSHSEGTDRAADSYRCCFAFKHTIVNLAEHPAVSGEWRGESLASLGGRYANLFSTAAGRYQITRATWIGCRDALNLPDFGPASQDAAAISLIGERGGLNAVDAGDFQQAIHACREEWASLPGGSSGQPQRALAELIASYTQAGGVLA